MRVVRLNIDMKIPYAVKILSLFWYVLGTVMLLFGIWLSWIILHFPHLGGLNDYFLIGSVSYVLVTFLIFLCTTGFIRGSENCARILVTIAVFITATFTYWYFRYLFGSNNFNYPFTSKQPYADIINNTIYFSIIYVGIFVIGSHQIRTVKEYLRSKSGSFKSNKSPKPTLESIAALRGSSDASAAWLKR